MEKKTDQTKKKGIFTLLKESMTKTSEGCGPSCGCHSKKNEENKNEKNG